MQIHKLDIDGYELQVAREGSGHPLVLLHGSVADLRIWQRHAHRLAKSFDVIVPSLRYHGESAWPDDGQGYGSEQHASDLLFLLNEWQLNDVICAGWSYGCNVGFHAGLIAPELFSQMYFYEPASASLVEDDAHRAIAMADRLAMFRRTADELLGSVNSTAANQTAVNFNKAVKCFIDDAVDSAGGFKSMDTHSRKVCKDNADTLNLLLRMTPPELSLKEYSVPTVIACGTETRDFYQITATCLEQQCECITTKWIKDAKHLWPVLKTSRFCTQLEKLQQVPA